MTHDAALIERLAREAGFEPWRDGATLRVQLEQAEGWVECSAELRRFAALVAEECARVADDTATVLLPTGSFLSERCGAAIRAKFKEPT